MGETTRTSPFGTRVGVAEFDNLFDAPVMIDVPHHEIHEGDTFFSVLYDEDAASGHVIQMYLKTPATANPQKRAHMVVSRYGSGEHTYRIKRGVTYSSGGADATAYNRNHGSSKTTSCQAFKQGSDKGGNAITVSGGTTIWENRTGDGKGLGGGSRDAEEHVLAPDTEYVFEVEANAAGILLSLALDWYEHTDDV